MAHGEDRLRAQTPPAIAIAAGTCVSQGLAGSSACHDRHCSSSPVTVETSLNGTATVVQLFPPDAEEVPASPRPTRCWIRHRESGCKRRRPFPVRGGFVALDIDAVYTDRHEGLPGLLYCRLLASIAGVIP